jgi:predicted Fe-Mo cluster-binding NifX family protein
MNVRLEYDMHWRAGIWFENTLQINSYNMELAITTNTANADDHVTSLSRLNHFIYNEMANTVYIQQDDTAQIQALTTAGIKVTTLPEQPIDQIIGIALYSKLNAILQERMFVNGVTIQSDLGDNVRYLHNDRESLGPLNQPGWWQDPSPMHSDFKSSASKKHVVRLNRTLSWQDLELEWSDVEPTDNTGNTVVFAKFGPDEN